MSTLELIEKDLIEDAPSDMLEKASADLDSWMHDLKTQAEPFGPMGQALLGHYQQIQERILDELNGRHGSDGMTPL